jgi:NTE family protein
MNTHVRCAVPVAWFVALFFALSTALAVLAPSSVRAQEAVVLSGGGSRGLAHAGVLQGLEERGHDPRIVVGTSMGAVVGALYAAGYDPAEIRRRIMEIEWDALFSPTPIMLGP